MLEGDPNDFRSAVIHIVDDDEPIRRALARLFRSVGAEARLFGSPEAYLSRPAQDKADCLLLDIHLPGMSGLDLYEQLLSSGGGVPVVFITAHPDGASRARARMMDASGYLEKPFDDSCLLAAVRKALTTAAEADNLSRPRRRSASPRPD